jgi:hypothetical protein
MLTAEQLKIASNLDRWDLRDMLLTAGYSGLSLAGANFLGLDNSHRFCYNATLYDESGTGEFGTAMIRVHWAQDGSTMLVDFDGQ